MLFPANSEQPDARTSKFLEIHGVSEERVYARPVSMLGDVEDLRQNVEVRAKQNGDLTEDETIAFFNIQQPSGQVVEVLPVDLEAYFLEIPGCSLRAIVGRRIGSDLDGVQAQGNQSVPYTLKEFGESTSLPTALRRRRPGGAGPGMAVHTLLPSEEEERQAKKREKNREKQARWRERQRANGKWVKRPRPTPHQQDMGQMASPPNVPHEAVTVIDGHQVQMLTSQNVNPHADNEDHCRNASVARPPTSPSQPKQEKGREDSVRHTETLAADFQPTLGAENMTGHPNTRAPFRPLHIDENVEIAVVVEGEAGVVAGEGDVPTPHASPTEEHT